MQMNVKEQINNFSEIYSEGLQDIIAASDLGRNIGLINSFDSRQKKQQNEEINTIYNRIKKFIEENVLNYQYREILFNKITFLFQYGEISSLKTDGDIIEVIGSVTSYDENSSIYTLGININQEKILINSIDEKEDKSITNNIEITYKVPQDNMAEYIQDTTIHSKKYCNIDSWYLDEVVVDKYYALKKEDGNVITAFKRRNAKETTTLLCSNHPSFQGDRVIKEQKKSTTLWNGIGENIGYVIGSYNDSTIEYGKKTNVEEYFYATRNNCPTLCDITSDVIKVPLTYKEFFAAIEGVTLEETIPISSKIIVAENEYTFGNSGTLKKIASTKPLV